ncbi:MAG: winged helix-turn-helix domain-containing protein [Pseudomonadota bacterium]
MSFSHGTQAPFSSNTMQPVAPFEVAGYRVEPSILRLTGAAGEVRLESKTMQVLVYLVEHAGRVVSRSELEERIWPGRIVTEDAVTNTILKLRRAFRDSARHPHVIETIPKTGYRLIAEVVPCGEANEEGKVSSISTTSKVRGWGQPVVWTTGAFLLLLLFLSVWSYLGKDQPAANRIGSAPGKPAVAILPFENLAADSEQDYFADGITADLITDLSKVSGLLVIAPGSVFAYRDSDAGPRQISSELNVDYVVVGSIQRSGDRLRVNVQLINTSDELTHWGERYETVMNDVFVMQDRLTADVIKALKVELIPVEREILAKRPTAIVVAYDYYLRGLEAHGHRSREQNLSAREHFARAIELDPAFARAYAGLAMTHSREAIDGWTATPSRSLEQAARLAETAAKMDPSLPQVYFISGQANLFRRRHALAIEATQRAIRVDPNYADAYALGAWIMNYAGRADEARTLMDQAMRLNPRPTASYLEVLGEIRFAQGQYDESVVMFDRVLHINPNYMRARMWITAILAYTGAVDRAEWEATELMVLSPGFSISQLEFAFPFKDPRVREALLAGLRKAGLPNE